MSRAVTVSIEKIYAGEGKIILLVAIHGPQGCWRREAITSIHGGRLTAEQLSMLHDGWRHAQEPVGTEDEEVPLPLDWGV